MSVSNASIIAGAFGLATFIVMALDMVYLKSFYFLAAYKDTFLLMLWCSGLFSLLHGLAALVPESAVFFTNVASVCKVRWVYCYLCLLMSNFNPHGYGGMRENVDRAGLLLEDAKIPELRNLPCCIPFTCNRSFTPNREWILSCIFRVKIYLSCEIFTLIVTQVLEDQNLLWNENGSPKLAERLMRFVGVLVLLFGVSGFLSLRRLLLPLVLPDHRHHVAARATLCSIFFTWIGGLQSALLSICRIQQNQTYAVIAVEMFIFQIFCHKYFVPSFVWGYGPPDFHAQNVQQKLKDYKFLIPVEDMAMTIVNSSRFAVKDQNAYAKPSSTEMLPVEEA